jgi:hypothetical protein
MTDAQILTLALSIALPLAALILSNSRITDAKEALRAEAKTNHLEVMNALGDLRRDVDQRIDLLTGKVIELMERRG